MVFLELLVEVVNLTVIMARWWCINLFDGDVERSYSWNNIERKEIEQSMSMLLICIKLSDMLRFQNKIIVRSVSLCQAK